MTFGKILTTCSTCSTCCQNFDNPSILTIAQFWQNFDSRYYRYYRLSKFCQMSFIYQKRQNAILPLLKGIHSCTVIRVSAVYFGCTMHAGVRPHMHLDLDAPRRMSTRRGEQLAFAQLSRIIHRIWRQARGGSLLYLFCRLFSSFAASFPIHWYEVHYCILSCSLFPYPTAWLYFW